MINFVTVCVDKYPTIYAAKLHAQFARLSNLPINHYCITDRPLELPSFIMALDPFIKSKGWWNKLNLFSPEMPKGGILYLDLDIVLMQNFDDEILYMQSRKEEICCVSDSICWMGEKFSSSLMYFNSGALSRIFEEFLIRESKINDRPGGDQVWIGPQLKSVSYIDEAFPKLKKNFKFQLCQNVNGEIIAPIEIDNEIKMVDCSGNPKPHQLNSLPYINENWHQIQ